MKYIVISVKFGGMERELPFIFPDAIVHAQMFQYMSHQMTMRHDANSVTCVAAGFLSSVGVGTAGQCHGESESLGIKSRGEEDDKLIMMLDYTHGVKI